MLNYLLRILELIKYVLLFYFLGGREVLLDFMNLKKNRVDLKKIKKHVAIVTGGSRGIGSSVVKLLLQCEMNVVIACRDIEEGREMLLDLRDNGVNCGSATILHLELTSMKSIQSFATAFYSQFQYLNLLVNNGIMFAPYNETEEGYELHFGVNYLGHFLLTQLMLPAMKRAEKTSDCNPRIVNVSSCVHELSPVIDFSNINTKNHYIPHAAYAKSKLCVLMISKILNRILKNEGSNIQVIVVNPGVVNTRLFEGTLIKNIAPWFLKYFCKSVDQGATTVTYCCIDDELEYSGGYYFSNCRHDVCSNYSNDMNTQQRLYDFSMNIVNPFLIQSNVSEPKLILRSPRLQNVHFDFTNLSVM